MEIENTYSFHGKPYQKLRLVCECDSENRGIIKCFDNVINFNAAIRVRVNNVIRKII